LKIRWDEDERGSGIADGSAFAANVEELRDAMAREGWVAEHPEAHLLPHLERHCAAESCWRIAGHSLGTDGVFDVVLDWHPETARFERLRRDVFGLVASAAEPATYVYQRAVRNEVDFEVVFGVLDAHTSRFVSHGHLVRLRIRGDAVRRVMRGHEDATSSSQAS
jgi:hypothetical protein